MPSQASTLLCVDVSYVLFYRYNALRRWYRHRHQEDIPEAYVRSDEFTTLFHKRLQDTLLAIVKVHAPTHVLMAYDGRANWRKQVAPTYKATRDHAPLTLEVFRAGVAWCQTSATAALTADVQAWLAKPRRGKKTASAAKGAPTLTAVPHVVHLGHEALEADDLVHLAVAQHQTGGYASVTGGATTTAPPPHSIVIANDHDYLPLLRFPCVTLVNLQGKPLTLPEGVSADQMLTYKALVGDKSDNLPPPIPRCGKKTAVKYVNDAAALEKALTAHPEARAALARNLQLMDNTRAPAELLHWATEQLAARLWVGEAAADETVGGGIGAVE